MKFENIDLGFFLNHNVLRYSSALSGNIGWWRVSSNVEYIPGIDKFNVIMTMANFDFTISCFNFYILITKARKSTKDLYCKKKPNHLSEVRKFFNPAQFRLPVKRYTLLTHYPFSVISVSSCTGDDYNIVAACIVWSRPAMAKWRYVY